MTYFLHAFLMNEMHFYLFAQVVEKLLLAKKDLF